MYCWLLALVIVHCFFFFILRFKLNFHRMYTAYELVLSFVWFGTHWWWWWWRWWKNWCNCFVYMYLHFNQRFGEISLHTLTQRFLFPPPSPSLNSFVNDFNVLESLELITIVHAIARFSRLKLIPLYYSKASTGMNIYTHLLPIHSSIWV